MADEPIPKVTAAPPHRTTLLIEVVKIALAVVGLFSLYLSIRAYNAQADTVAVGNSQRLIDQWLQSPPLRNDISKISSFTGQTDYREIGNATAMRPFEGRKISGKEVEQAATHLCNFLDNVGLLVKNHLANEDLLKASFQTIVIKQYEVHVLGNVVTQTEIGMPATSIKASARKASYPFQPSDFKNFGWLYERWHDDFVKSNSINTKW